MNNIYKYFPQVYSYFNASDFCVKFSNVYVLFSVSYSVIIFIFKKYHPSTLTHLNESNI